MRIVCWGQVTDHSQHPASWNELEVDDAADTLEIKNQILEDGSFADPPELRLLSDRGAWRKWEKLQTLPSGDIKVKVICLRAGQFDVHILATCHFSCSAYCIEQVASWRMLVVHCVVQIHCSLLTFSLSCHLLPSECITSDCTMPDHTPATQQAADTQFHSHI